MAKVEERKRRRRVEWQKPLPVLPMDAAEFMVVRQELGMEGRPYPMTHLAKALGYAGTSSLYAFQREDANIPGSVAKLMRIFREVGFVY